MGGNYNEGSWSCRLIGFFHLDGTGSKLPMGHKSAHLKSETGQKKLEEEKSKDLKGLPLTSRVWEVTFGLPVNCLWLLRFFYFLVQLLSSTLMASIIGTFFFPYTGVTAVEAIDNPEKSTGIGTGVS